MPSLTYEYSPGLQRVLTFVTLGEVVPPVRETEEITRPNVSGRAFRDIGTRGQEQTLVGRVDFNAAVTPTATMRAYLAAAVGRPATWVDDFGDSHAIFIRRMLPADDQGIIRKIERNVGGVTDGAATHRVLVRYDAVSL